MGVNPNPPLISVFGQHIFGLPIVVGIKAFQFPLQLLALLSTLQQDPHMNKMNLRSKDPRQPASEVQSMVCVRRKIRSHQNRAGYVCHGALLFGNS